MPFDRRAGGHAFDFHRGVCVKCGMTREYYQDNGEPVCSGRAEASRRRQNEPRIIESEE